MKTAIVTGANGFIGSHLAYQLLGQGWSVYALGRSSASERWRLRMEKALREVDAAAGQFDALQCCEFDILSQSESWEQIEQGGGLPNGAVLFHVAGDTQFTPQDAARRRTVNVGASVAIMKRLKGKIARAIHVSTAFVAGDRGGLVGEDELDCGQHFHNNYEQTKLEAEAAVTSTCRECNIPLIIARPSIITNDRRTGRASTFTHFNALVEVITRIQKHYQITDGQTVSKRVRLMADAAARPNLAPVDSIVPPLLKIATADNAAGNTYNLCHPYPESNTKLVALICEAFGFGDNISFEFLNELAAPLTYTEEMILRSLKPYGPYLNARCEFDLRQSRSVVPDYDSYFTQPDVAYLKKVISFQRNRRAAWRNMDTTNPPARL